MQDEEGALISCSALDNDVPTAELPRRGRRVVALTLALGVFAAFCTVVASFSHAQKVALTRYRGGEAVHFDGVDSMKCDRTTAGANRRLFNLTLPPPVGNMDICRILPSGIYSCSAPPNNGWTCTATIKCPTSDADKLSICCNGICEMPHYCFPGEAIVVVEGKGLVPISTLRIGDSVLARKRSGALHYERVLGFLHHTQASDGSFVQLSLASGEFRATSNHMVFTMEQGSKVSKTVGEIRVGDMLFVGDVTSEVRAVAEGFTKSGMFSPLTSSGTVVVDNVVASIYAQTSDRSKFPHAAAHAFFFLARAYYAFTPSSPLPSHEEFMHPLAAFLHKRLHLESLLSE